MNTRGGGQGDGVALDNTLAAVEHLKLRMDSRGRHRTSMLMIDVLDTLPEWQRLRADVDRTSRSLIRLRQRIVAPVLPVGDARWVTDPDFDLDYHLRRVSLPSAGWLRQLLDVARVMQAAPLDRNRPLWEATLVEGLDDADGCAAAIVWKFDHTVMGGIGCQMFERLMRSAGPDADHGPLPKLPSPEDLSSTDLTRREVKGLPLAAGRLILRAAGDTVGLASGSMRDPRAAWSKATRIVQSVMPRPRAAPRSPLLLRRGLNNRFETMDTALADLHATAGKHGCSVTDVCITAVCGGLKLYHQKLGLSIDTLPLGLPVYPPPQNVPASGRSWPGVRIAAPVGEMDVIHRMRVVRDAVASAHAEPLQTALRIAAPAIAWLPDPFLATVAEIGIDADVLVGHGTGPAEPVYVAGTRVRRVIPIGPLAGAAMMIALYSTDGRCHLGVNLDTLAVTDPSLLLACLHHGFAEAIAAGQESVALISAPRKRAASRSTRRGGAKP